MFLFVFAYDGAVGWLGMGSRGPEASEAVSAGGGEGGGGNAPSVSREGQSCLRNWTGWCEGSPEGRHRSRFSFPFFSGDHGAAVLWKLRVYFQLSSSFVSKLLLIFFC